MKEEISRAYRMALEEKLKEAKQSYETAKKDTIEAEGRMVTRYDSTKTETAWLADGYLEVVKALEQALDNLQSDNLYINVGDRVTLDLLEGGVYKERKKIIVERTNFDWAVLGSALVGKKPGEVLQLRQDGRYVVYQIRSREGGENSHRIALGSLVKLKDSVGEQEWYYLVPEQGGIEIMVGKEQVFCISGGTPLAQHLLDRSQGEQVEIGGEEFQIIAVE